MGRLLAVLLTLAATTCLFSEALAHKVSVFAYVEGDEIVVEGFFGGKSKCRECQVAILDATGKKLVETKTDSTGTARIKISDLGSFEGRLNVSLVAGEGHIAQYPLDPADLPGTDSKAVDSGTGSKPPAQASAPQPVPAAAERPAVAQELAGALDKSLEKRLDPIVKKLGKLERMLLEMQDQGPTVKDIVGGIGWILGIVGIAAFFLSRNGKR